MALTFGETAAVLGGQTLLNGIGSLLGLNAQADKQMNMWREQWTTAYSPKAQVRNLAAAGINPAVAFGQNAPVISSAPSVPSVASPQFGVQGLGELGSYIQALSQADVNEVTRPKIVAETAKILSEKEANDIQNHIQSEYGLKMAGAELGKIAKEIVLLSSQDEVAKTEAEFNRFKTATEKVLAEYHGKQRDLLQKDLNSYETRLQFNLNEQKSRIKANYASASLSTAQAMTEDATRDYRAFAIDLANHMQGLEYGFNIDTYQNRLEKFAHEVGIAKWTEFLNSLEAKDRAAYNAVQRIIMGKGTKEDGKTFWNLVNDGRQLIPFK